MDSEAQKFVDKQFTYWRNKDMPWTYVAPQVFAYIDDFVPVKGASNYIPELYNKKTYYDKAAEEHVLNVFVRFGDYTNQPMFIFPNFKIKQLIETLRKYGLTLNEKGNLIHNSYETDLIIVHRKIGIILVEVKSNIESNGHYEKAQKQLNEREKVLNRFPLIPTLNDFDLSPDNSSQLQKYFITKVIACPYQHKCQIEDPKLRNPAEYIDLCKEHMNSLKDFCEWWFLNITKNKLFNETKCKFHFESIYYDLIPKIFHWYICSDKKLKKLNLDMTKKIDDTLKFQKSLSAQLQIEISKHRTITSKIKDAHSELNKLTELQSLAEFESHIEKLQLHIKNIKLQAHKLKPSTNAVQTTEPSSVLHDIWKHFTFEQSEMWVKKKQIILGPYGSGKTVLIQCKAADLARSGANVLVVLPSHLMMKYKIFFNEHASDIYLEETGEPINDKVKQTKPEKDTQVTLEVTAKVSQENGGYYDKFSVDPPPKEPEPSPRSDENHCTSNKCKRVIKLVSMTKFLKLFESDYKHLIQNSHVFIDEFLWPHFKHIVTELGNSKRVMLNDEEVVSQNVNCTFETKNDPTVKDRNKFLEFLFQQLSDDAADKAYHLWIVPHLYIILACLLTDRFQQDEVKYFLLKLEELDKSFITTLNTTLRTTKQINDFITQKQQQDLSKFFTTELNEKLFKSKIFTAALCNSHGHHISGPPVRIFCHQNFHCFENFQIFFVKVIDTEADRLTSSTFKLQDIAVIVDAYTQKSLDIKRYLLDHLQHQKVTFKEHYEKKKKTDEKEEPDAIVICDSRDIASEEWPVVIHVKYFYDYNDRLQTKGKLGNLTYFESFHNMIASRCTVEYIIICCKGEEDAWPHNESCKTLN